MSGLSERGFPERSHWTCLDQGWEEVADLALDWATRNARAGGPVSPNKGARPAG